MADAAEFTIDDTAFSTGGYDATNGAVLNLALSSAPALDSARVVYSVVSRSVDAPDPVFSPANGIPATPTSIVTLTLPASDVHSYRIQCQVNEGTNASGRLDRGYTKSRIVAIRSPNLGLRKYSPGETTEYHPAAGWVEEQNRAVDALDVVGGGGGASASTNMIAGAGLTGGGTLAADRTFNVVANADGSIVVNANDIQVGVISDAQHGTRGGGTTHAAAIASGAAGFMSGADKAKLDGLPNSPIASIGVTAPVQSTGGTAPTISLLCGVANTALSVPRRDAGGILEQRVDAVGVASTIGAVLSNTTAATGPNPQWSPILALQGREASGSDQAVWMGLQARNAGETSVVKLSILSKIGAGSWTEVAALDGAGALDCVSGTFSSFVSAPDHYADNIYGSDGGGLNIEVGSSSTTQLRVDGALIMEVSANMVDHATAISLPVISPAAAGVVGRNAAGNLVLYFNSEVRTTALELTPFTHETATVDLIKGKFNHLNGSIVTGGATLPTAIGVCWELWVVVTASGVDIIPFTDNNLMGGGTYNQLAGTTVHYAGDGNGNVVRIVCA